MRELNVNTPPREIDNLLALVLAGADAGLVSEAGCPAVADPGTLLVRRAHERGVKVVPFVGPKFDPACANGIRQTARASRSTAICP